MHVLSRQSPESGVKVPKRWYVLYVSFPPQIKEQNTRTKRKGDGRVLTLLSSLGFAFRWYISFFSLFQHTETRKRKWRLDYQIEILKQWYLKGMV